MRNHQLLIIFSNRNFLQNFHSKLSEYTIQRKLSVRMLWSLTLIVGVFAYVNSSQISPNDFWWHMAVGKDILKSYQIPSVDIYSYTMAGQPYPSYQMFWFMDVWLFSLYNLGGLELVLFSQSLIITGTYFIILILCWRNSQKWGVTTLCILFAIILGIYAWSVRTQAISFLIGTLFLLAIYSYRRQPNNGWFAVFLLGMLVWVNSHGSFPVGLLMIGIWFADELYRFWKSRRKGTFEPLNQLIVPGFTMVLSTSICLVNPRGENVLDYLITMATNQIVQNSVPEWAPPSITSPIGILYFSGILITALILAISQRRPTFFQLATFLAFALLGIRTTRGVIWFGLTIAPILASHLSTIIEQKSKNPSVHIYRLRWMAINLSILVILFILAMVSLPWLRGIVPKSPEGRTFLTHDTPVEATQYLVDEHLPGRLFNDIAFGSYLIWAAQPNYQVFVDTRIELFPPDIWHHYQIISNSLPGWENVIENYDIQTFMLNPIAQEPLAHELKLSSKWRLIYSDNDAWIFTRNR